MYGDLIAVPFIEIIPFLFPFCSAFASVHFLGVFAQDSHRARWFCQRVSLCFVQQVYEFSHGGIHLSLYLLALAFVSLLLKNFAVIVNVGLVFIE